MEELVTPVRRRRRRRRRTHWPILTLIGLLGAALLGFGILAGVHIINDYHVDLTLTGAQELVLEYGATYDEPGAVAVGYGTLLKKEHQPLQVQIGGKVDTNQLGTYTLTYDAYFEGAANTASRKVTVVDTVAPVISLTSKEGHFTLPGQPYQEEGFTATDNHDGDISSMVKVVEENGKILYTVSDASGNTATAERQIFYDDPVAPELIMNGEASATITEGDKWKDPGCTASDNVDGDITDKVTVSGSVDHKKPGTYKVTYQVSDSFGNEAKAERTVTVKAKPKPEPKPETQTSQNQGGSTQQGSQSSQSGSTQQGSQSSQSGSTQPSQNLGKVIYLTFDDGPSKHTARLLETLAKYNAKATFFVCDTGGYYNVLKDIVDQGHGLALHSKSHEYSKIYSSEEAFYEDLNAIKAIVEKYAGITPNMMRFPGGSSNGVSKKHNKGIMTRLTKSVQENGYYYYDWNVDSKDAGGAKTAAEVADNVISGIKNSKRKSLVVLQHDIKGFSVDAVEEILKWGIENGCTFKALSPEAPECHHGVNN